MDELVQAYRSGRVLLFVGAGVSMNLGLPSWSRLTDRMALDLDFDPAIYRTYGDYLALAEYYRIKKGKIGSLRSWMDREWHAAGVDLAKSRIHELIARGSFDLIYTTNYDRWIERALEHYGQSFDKITNVGDLVTADSGKRQVVKFHGDFDDDSSIVLDESSYYRRLDFESPLDIKLRADVLGRSVLVYWLRLRGSEY
ncbi:SIR2 family protein [Agrobacterium sp. S2]|nr:SIR2 family protein [Agrobacterium sp. S2]